MNTDRERAVAAAFVSVASDLANGFDVVEMLTGLTTTCVHLLDITSAGLLLADRRRVLHLMAASSEATRSVELFQLQREEGPCLDSYQSGLPVSVPDLGDVAGRWPHFVAAAQAHEFASVHAVPLRFRDNVVGALGLFGSQVGALNDDDLRLAQALADVASVALLQDRAATDSNAVNDQLQTALNHRVVLEQAKGILAQLGDLDMEDSFRVLRLYARDHNRRLSELALAITRRTQDAAVVLAHAQSRRIRPSPDRSARDRG